MLSLRCLKKTCFGLISIILGSVHVFGEWLIKDDNLVSSQEIVLRDVPGSVSIETTRSGVFLKLTSKNAFTEKEFFIGKSPENIQFSSAYRAISSCWMETEIGDSFDKVPRETQFLITRDNKTESYTIYVPLIDGKFRSSLIGNKNQFLNLIAESGDSEILTKSVTGLYIISGEDPFEMMEVAAREIREWSGSNEINTVRQLPEIGEYFGWCTWNAFYNQITGEKVRLALDSFRLGNCTPKWVLMDDGWQMSKDRLVTGLGADKEKFPEGLAGFTKSIKEEYGIKKTLTWQTLWGYWLGCDINSNLPWDVEIKKTYVPKRLKPKSTDQKEMDPEDAILARFYPYRNFNEGIQLPDIPEFYRIFHHDLKESGIDGVKIDAMTWIEATGDKRGGRVTAMKELLDAMDRSSLKLFDNNTIYCSGCSNDLILGARRNTVVRSSKDFRPAIPVTHGEHIFLNAYNSFFMGEFVIPDWDMFQSGHEAGAFHAAARAISGGPVYCADEIGGHNYDVLKRLMLSDGRIPQPTTHARPTLDTFFVDPKITNTPIKIFNTNSHGGVIGAFNCSYVEGNTPYVRGTVSPSDIPSLNEGIYVLYAHGSKELVSLSQASKIPVELGEYGYEIFTVVPVQNGFAPIGLSGKYNSGGTITSVTPKHDGFDIKLMDGGQFIAWSENEPVKVMINGQSVPFHYNSSNRKLSININQSGTVTVNVSF